jgi:hypothetical protein
MLEKMQSTNLKVALKEWHATIAALEAGRQILLLRKGGLLDPEGAFALEYSRFWLAPTRFHQDENFVKSADVSFLQTPPRAAGVLPMRSYARVEKTWTVPFEKSEKLAQLDHIWSARWLETRFDYQRENPLLVVALRVFVLPSAQNVVLDARDSGCKSWIENTPLPAVQSANAALSEVDFTAGLRAAERVLGA